MSIKFGLLFATILVASVNAQCGATNNAATLLNQCTVCDPVSITANSGDIKSNSNSLTFSIPSASSSVVNCNSVGNFKYLNSNNQWVSDSTAFYSSPAPSPNTCAAKSRSQSCSQASSWVGKCIRIDLQGNGGYSIARMVSAATCGTAAPTPSATTSAPTPSTTTSSPTPSSTTAAPTPSSFCDDLETYKCFGAETSIVLGDRFKSNGTIVSAGTISIGSDTKFRKNVESASGPCTTPIRATFSAGSSFQCPTGEIAPLCPLPPTPAAGTTDINIPNYSRATLAPGNYRHINIGEGAVVQVESMDVFAQSFTMGNQARFNASSEFSLPFFGIYGKIKIGDRAAFTGFPLGVGFSSFYTSAAGNGDAAIWIGSDLNNQVGSGSASLNLYAPYGLISLSNRARIYGVVIADRIISGEDVSFTCLFE